MTNQTDAGLERENRAGISKDNPAVEPTIVMPQNQKNDRLVGPGIATRREPSAAQPEGIHDHPTAPTVVRPRKPLPAADTASILEPRWKISPLIAALSLLAALVAGVALASFLVSRANRDTQNIQPVPQSIPQAGTATPISSTSDPDVGGGANTGHHTEGAQPQVFATPVPDAPTITETEPTPPLSAPPVYRNQSSSGTREADKDRPVDEDRDRDGRDRELDKRDRKRDKREEERKREDAKREAKREQEQAKREREDREDREDRDLTR